MSARKFIQRLQQQGLLDDVVLAELRKQMADSKTRVTAELVAKTLVDKGHLTKFQATKLVGEVTAEAAAEKARQDDDELLGLAPMDDDEPVAPAKPAAPAPSPPKKSKASAPEKKSKPPNEAVDEIVLLEDIADEATFNEGLTPIGAPPSGLTPLMPLTESMGGLSRIESAPMGYSDMLGSGGMGSPSVVDPFGMPLELPPGHRPSKRSKPKNNIWDTKLIVVGGGALIGLLCLGVILFRQLTAESSADMYSKADEQYKAMNYATARVAYEEFGKRYPKDANTSQAKVRVGMSRIRQALEVQKDYQEALTAVQDELPKVQNEIAFNEARTELQTIIPDIAAGFATLAKNTANTEKAQELVDLAEKAMESVNNPVYLPTSFIKQQESKIKAILEDIALAKRSIDREQRLVQTIADIQTALAAQQTAKAFATYRALLNEYPGLDKEERLQKAVLEISQKERDLVQVVDEQPRHAVPETNSVGKQFVLANRSGAVAPGVEKSVALFLVRGSVYALNAADGKMLWRRYVGHETMIQPQAVNAQAGADALVSDLRRQEVLRLKVASGEVLWRFPVQERFSSPVIISQRVFIPAQSGRLYTVDIQSGEATKSIVFPQALNVGPVATSDGTQMFQVSDHSNLYSLAVDSLQCKDVYFVGHKSGSIACPTVYTQSHILVIENGGRDSANVHVIAAKAGQPLTRAQDPFRLKGNVVVPPVVFGRRVLVVTNLAGINVFDVDATNAKQPVTIVASVPPISQLPLTVYPLVDQGRLWTADQRLSRYDIQFAQGKLSRAWIVDEGDTFAGPLQRFGDVLISVRRPQGSSAYVVSAKHCDNRTQFWQTELAVPAGHVTADTARGVRVIGANAVLFAVTKDVLASGYADQPLAVVPSGKGGAFTQAIELDEGRLALYSSHDNERLLIYDPSQENAPLRFLTRPPMSGQITAKPVSFAGGLIVPTDTGVVSLVDPRSGDDLVLPFQPKVEAGTRIQWRRPAVLPGGKELVIADDKQNVYRLAVKDQPRKHLAAVEEFTLEINIVSPLAAVGDLVYGAVRGQSADVVVALQTNGLKPSKEIALQGRVIWGPESVGDVVFVQSNVEGILCLDGTGQQRWAFESKSHGQLAGPPVAVNDAFVFSSIQGTVWSLAGDTGAEQGRIEIGEPLANGPVVFGTRLLLCGTDGAMHVLAIPSPQP